LESSEDRKEFIGSETPHVLPGVGLPLELPAMEGVELSIGRFDH